MPYYPTNPGALLFMGQSTASPLPAPGADVFDEVPLLGSITPPAIEKSVARFNIQNDGNKRAVGGKKGDQTVPGDLVIDWEEPIHQQMFADANGETSVYRNWYILYPDQNGRRLDYQGFLSKWNEQPLDSAEDAKEHRADFEIAVDGAVTATP